MSDPGHRITSVWISAIAGIVLVALGLFFLRFELTIRAPGTVNARDEVRVFAPMDGVIAGHFVQLGQVVTNGQVLLALDDADLSLRAIAVERELAETEAALEQNRIALAERTVRPGPAELITADERKERLSRIAIIQQEIETNYTEARGLQVISELEMRRQEIERLRSELDLVQASLLAEWQKAGLPAFEGERLAAEQKRLQTLARLHREELALVNERRAASRIAAPAAGQVVALNPRFPGMSVSRGAEVLKLAATSGPCQVRTYIPERNVDLVRVGTRALMESAVFDSMLEGYVEGTVARIAPEGTAGANEMDAEPRYEVDIDVQSSPYPLVLGSGVHVRLMLGRRPLSDLLLRTGDGLRQPRREAP